MVSHEDTKDTKNQILRFYRLRADFVSLCLRAS